MSEPTYRIAQALHARRAAVGLPKYGQHLSADSPGCMLVHALEESADQVNYLLAEIQRRRLVIKELSQLAHEMWESKQHTWARRIQYVADLLGGGAALAKYDEILGGAEDATPAPERGMPKEQIDRIRQEIAKFASINRPLTIEERKDFDRTLEQLRDADEAPDPRDEALRVATKLVEKLDAVHNDPKYERVWIVHQQHCGPYSGLQYDRELDELKAALAAIRRAR